MDAAVLDQLGERDAGDLTPDRVEAAQNDGLGRVVDDQIDAGRLLEGADVATLAADDAALHLVARQVDDADRVLGRVVGGDALHGRHDDVASLLAGLFAGGALDRTSEADGIVLGFLTHGFEQETLRVGSAQPADTLKGGHLVLGRPGKLLARLVKFAFALDELAIALLDHVGALVDLLVALEEAALEVVELTPLRASFVLSFTLQAQLLVLGLEDQVLLLGSGSLDDQGSLLLGLLDPPARPDAPAEEAEYGDADEGEHAHRQEHDLHHVLPSGRHMGRW